MSEVPTSILPGGAGVEVDGEILNFDDAGIDPEDLVDASREPDIDRIYEEALTRALVSDFSSRNQTLTSLTEKIGWRNRVHGQIQQAANGNPKFGPVWELEERKGRLTKQARELGEKACQSCALAEFCTTTPEQLVAALVGDPGDRSRFKSRVNRPDNNKFCSTNLQPGRIPRDSV